MHCNTRLLNAATKRIIPPRLDIKYRQDNINLILTLPDYATEYPEDDIIDI